MRLIASWLLNTAVIGLVAAALPGISIANVWSALLTVPVLGLINAVVRPLLVLLTLPAVVLTFGLFLFVLNAVGLWLAAAIVPGFRIDGFGNALLGSILISVLSSFGRWLLRL
ncbi:MAG: phage holin family protein [Chlorobiota bacterium]